MKSGRFIVGMLAAAGSTGLIAARAQEAVLGNIRITFEKRGRSGLMDRFTPEQFAAALLVETNRVRVANGRRPLKAHPTLQGAADDQARTLALSGRSEHYSPLVGQHDVVERAQRHGFERGTVGENVLAMSLRLPDEAPPSCASVAADAVARWMDSPPHRANLLNRTFTHFGGAVQLASPLGGDAERVYGVQVFGAW